MFQRVALHCRRDLTQKEDFTHLLELLLQKTAYVAVTEQAALHIPEALPSVDFEAMYDFFLVVGGDGSILSVVRRMKNFQTPILPLCAGTLGFLAELTLTEFERAYSELLAGHMSIDRRMLLSVHLKRKNGEVEVYHALNDAVVSQSQVARMAKIETQINGEYLTTYAADGLIVSTPTGSTAYSLAAGGPILYPRFSALILSPIAPHSFTHKPLVLPEDKTISISADAQNNEPLTLTIDGQFALPLGDGDIVDISVHQEKLQFLRLPEEHFFKTIKRKLHWGRRI